MASLETRKNYLVEGMKFAEQARHGYPGCGPLEALCRHAESRIGVLTPSSVRVYWQQYARAVESVGKTEKATKEAMRAALARSTSWAL